MKRRFCRTCSSSHLCRGSAALYSAQRCPITFLSFCHPYFIRTQQILRSPAFNGQARGQSWQGDSAIRLFHSSASREVIIRGSIGNDRQEKLTSPNGLAGKTI